MKIRIKSWIALLLALALAFSLAACGKKDSGTQGGKETEETPEFVYQASYQTLSSTTNLSLAAITDTGFYATSYEKIGEAVPEGATVEYEGQYDVYGSCLYFVGFDGSVKKLENYRPMEATANTEGWQDFYSGASLSGLCLDGEGRLIVVENVYTSYYDGPESERYAENSWQYRKYTNDNYIRVLDADGSVQSSAKVQYGSEDSYLNIYRALIDDQGNLLATSDYGIVAIATDGSVAYIIESDNYIDSLVRLRDGRVAAMSWGENGPALFAVDAAAKALGEEIPLPYNAYNLISGGGDYDLYYNNGSNLYGYNIETQETAKVLNWINCDVNGNNLGNISILSDGRIMGVINEWKNGEVTSELMTLQQVPYDSVPRKQAITLAVMYLDYEMTNKIIDFNRHSDRCRIEVQDYSEYNSEEDWTAGQTKLTTEIMSGKMPDILCLNGLPYKQLAAKGLLEDLYPYLDADPELNRGDFFPTVLSALEVEGKLYQVTPSFSVQSLIGASSVVGDTPGWTYEEFNAALASMPDGCDPLDQYVVRGDILRTLVAVNMNDFVDWSTGKCSFDSQEFVELLKFANSFKAEFDWENYEWSESESTINRISSGRQMLMMASVYSMEDLKYNDMYFGGSSTYIGYPSSTGEPGNLFYFESGYAMSHSCADKDAAWEFLRTLLTEDYAKDIWGLPINRAAFDAKLKQAMTPEYEKDENGNYLLDEDGNKIEISQGGIGFSDGTTYEIYAMTQEQADRLLNLIETTTRAAEQNDSIFEIVSEQAEAYFAGQKTPEEVARLTQSKANIYVNEQR